MRAWSKHRARRHVGPSVPAFLRTIRGRRARLFEPCNQLRALFRVGNTRECHRSTRHGLHRICEKRVERSVVPNDFRAEHRRRVIETRQAARAAAEHAAMPGTYPVFIQRMTGHAARVNCLAAFELGLARRRRMNAAACQRQRDSTERSAKCAHGDRPTKRMPPAPGFRRAPAATPPSASPRRRECLRPPSTDRDCETPGLRPDMR